MGGTVTDPMPHPRLTRVVAAQSRSPRPVVLNRMQPTSWVAVPTRMRCSISCAPTRSSRRPLPRRPALHAREQTLDGEGVTATADDEQPVDAPTEPGKGRATLGNESGLLRTESLETKGQRVRREPVSSLEHELHSRHCRGNSEAGHSRTCGERSRTRGGSRITSDCTRVDGRTGRGEGSIKIVEKRGPDAVEGGRDDGLVLVDGQQLR